MQQEKQANTQRNRGGRNENRKRDVVRRTETARVQIGQIEVVTWLMAVRILFLDTQVGVWCLIIRQSFIWQSSRFDEPFIVKSQWIDQYRPNMDRLQAKPLRRQSKYTSRIDAVWLPLCLFLFLICFVFYLFNFLYCQRKTRARNEELNEQKVNVRTKKSCNKKRAKHEKEDSSRFLDVGSVENGA